jgi:hypothetical protein
MRDIAPFHWTHLYVFILETRREMQHRILHAQGLRWTQAPAESNPGNKYGSLLVFAGRTRILSVVRDGDIDFECLDDGRSWTPAHATFVVYRSAGDGDPAVGIPPDPPTLIATTPIPHREDSDCINAYGILH